MTRRSCGLLVLALAACTPAAATPPPPPPHAATQAAPVPPPPSPPFAATHGPPPKLSDPALARTLKEAGSLPPGPMPKLPARTRSRVFPSDVGCSRPEQGRLLGIWGSGRELFVAGDVGVLRSSDGGRSFVAQNLGGACGMLHVWGSGNDVFAVGVGGSVVHSGDLGKTWEVQISGTSDYLLDVWGPSADDVWVVAEHGYVLRTKDRGKTWTERQLAPDDATSPDTISRVWGLDARELFLTGRRGLVARSHDGGDTFLVDPTGIGYEFMHDVRGEAPADVWAVGESGVALHATSPGVWRRVSIPDTTTLTRVWTQGRSVVFMTWSDFVLASADGGATFQRVTVAQGETVFGIWGDGTSLYVVSTVGPGDMSSYAVNGGSVSKSTDGGLHWTRLWGTAASGRRVPVPG